MQKACVFLNIIGKLTSNYYRPPKLDTARFKLPGHNINISTLGHSKFIPCLIPVYHPHGARLQKFHDFVNNVFYILT